MALDASNRSYLDAAHLYRRAGFGGTQDDLQTAVAEGVPNAAEKLINFQDTRYDFDDDAFLERLLQTMPERLQGGNLLIPVEAMRIWWTYRLLTTTRPLEEKMVLFWHNHFTSKDDDGLLMMRQNSLFRSMALGNFRTLALAVSRDPEMLKYLNGNQNYRTHPNENYGRELMELFTCGRVGPDGKPNYTEDDVKAGAKAFSGWNMRGDAFYYNPQQHDDSVKTFMGHTGKFNGDDIIDILVSLPATANYLCGKLFRYFAYYDPEPSVMKELVRVYFDSGYDIKSVVACIFKSDAFWSDKARFGLFKSPTEYVVGSVRMAGLTPLFAPTLDDLVNDQDIETLGRGRRGQNPLARLAALSQAMRGMGQTLFAPETVKGWDGGEKWINTDTIQARAKFANLLSQLPAVTRVLVAPGSLASRPQRPQAQTAALGAWPAAADDPKALVDSLLWKLGPLNLNSRAYDALVNYAASETDPRVRTSGVFALVLGTPEFQMN